MFTNQPQYGYYQQPYYQPTPQPRPVQLNAILIDDVNMIKPSDISMDGRPTVFILKDFSAIFLKQWNANGTIDTLVMSPNIPETQPVKMPQDNANIVILNRLDAIERLLKDNGFVTKED